MLIKGEIHMLEDLQPLLLRQMKQAEIMLSLMLGTSDYQYSTQF